MNPLRPLFGAGLAALAFAGAAQAQVRVEPDGRWRHLLTAGASLASGNSDARSFNLAFESVQATARDKWRFDGRLLYGSNRGSTTSDLASLGTRYDRNFGDRWFGFGTGELLRDRPANLAGRLSVGAGVGRHLLSTGPHRFDVFGGLGYTEDRFREARRVAGELREHYGRAELLLGEESTHALTATTTVKQRLVVYPNLADRGEFRLTFDAGVSVAINAAMSLNVTLGHRHTSDPGVGLRASDTLLVTGVSIRLE